jgi:hypothetical protein
MSRTSIKDWLWSQHAPLEVQASFEKLFALPEKWREHAEILRNADFEYHKNEMSRMIVYADELSAILEGKD